MSFRWKLLIISKHSARIPYIFPKFLEKYSEISQQNVTPEKFRLCIHQYFPVLTAFFSSINRIVRFLKIGQFRLVFQSTLAKFLLLACFLWNLRKLVFLERIFTRLRSSHSHKKVIRIVVIRADRETITYFYNFFNRNQQNSSQSISILF